MKPLIKWTGGKSSELKHIEPFVPDFDRYIEPFFGGGALFFNLQPNNAIINDIIPNLMDFYRLVKEGSEEFRSELTLYATHWSRISDFQQCFSDELMKKYDDYSIDKLSDEEMIQNLDNIFDENSSIFLDLFEEEFCVERLDLLEVSRQNLLSRIFKLKKKIDKKNCFDSTDIQEHFETGLKSGFYTHFRNLHNQKLVTKSEISKEKEIANYYFIREYCFGGMFRHNNSGEFNIPYGGRNYNNKNFKRKIDYLFSHELQDLFNRTIIENDDFEKILIKHNLKKTDFMFLDPPYDSNFSNYDNMSFTHKDHIRLRNVLKHTKANYVLVIKETPFILNLYSDNRIFKTSFFEKTYNSNIKSRYNRETKHLIISNRS